MQIEEAVDKWVEDKVVKHSDTKYAMLVNASIRICQLAKRCCESMLCSNSKYQISCMRSVLWLTQKL